MRAQVSARVRADACDFGATRGVAMRRLKPFAAIWPVRPEDCQRASSVTERLTGRALGASREGAHGSGWGPAGGGAGTAAAPGRRRRMGGQRPRGGARGGRGRGRRLLQRASEGAAADGCCRGLPRGSRHLYVLNGIEVSEEVSRCRGDSSERQKPVPDEALTKK
jgi:hypothetical protein